MTLQEFLTMVGNQPIYVLVYFSIIPFTALLALIIGRNEGNLNPWTWLYSALIYLVSVPALFSLTLSIYLFLFERRSILDTDVYFQIVPVFSFFITLYLIRKNVSFDEIPGFDKLSGLVMMIFAVFLIMWIMDKTRIYTITFVPFYQVILIFIALFLVVRFGWSRLFK